ncbi:MULTISPECIES: DUF4229 domain-containing protein [Kineococcus]|uniref:DUF4229 domain-containing protein n=1 Tax=Kineococcus TaxID=33981 RepID=UPI0034DB4FEC
MFVAFRYSVLRLSIFVGSLLLLYLLGARGWLALGLAAVVSVLLSLVLLRKQRDAMAAEVQRRVDARVQGGGRRSRFERGLREDEDAEDR